MYWLFVFDSYNHYTDTQILNKIWRVAAQKAGYAHCNLNLYLLRHSLASAAVNRGVSEKLIGDFLGHTDLKTTSRYAHVEITGLRKVLNPTPIIEINPGNSSTKS